MLVDLLGEEAKTADRGDGNSNNNKIRIRYGVLDNGRRGEIAVSRGCAF